MSAAGESPVDEVSVHVAAPPELVWDLIADVTRMGDWSPECRGGRWLGRTRRPEVGARFLGVNRRGWARWATTNVVEEAERGRTFAFRTQQSGATWGYRFEPEGEGTRLTETRRFRRGRTLVGRVSTSLFLGGSEQHDDELRAGMRRTLERVKAAAEAEAGAAATEAGSATASGGGAAGGAGGAAGETGTTGAAGTTSAAEESAGD